MRVSQIHTNNMDLYPHQTKNALTEMADHLLLYGGLLSDLGLFHGQMGVILALFHHGRGNDEQVVIDIAQELLQDLLDSIDDSLLSCLDSGYAGLAWGLCYLQWASFIDVDLSDLLEEVDNKIKETDITRISDLSLEKGLVGILHYVLFLSLVQPSFASKDPAYMASWKERMSRDRDNIRRVNPSGSEWIGEHLDISAPLDYSPRLVLQQWLPTECLGSSFDPKGLPIGLRQGIAGQLLKAYLP